MTKEEAEKLVDALDQAILDYESTKAFSYAGVNAAREDLIEALVSGEQKQMEKDKPNWHQLKIDPEYFYAVKFGLKTFEVRLNDRGFKVGDIVCLNEYIANVDHFTSEKINVKITYILTDSTWVENGHCIFSFKVI